MAKYQVTVTIEYSGHVDLEATSAEEAEQAVREQPSEYLEQLRESVEIDEVNECEDGDED